ncbi:hypothetical protein B0H14DRAFT_3588027 [Mycena olivaceomarginata]|nr:hypothetical protein B0H14DRAFT_3588027 [Mycena olivaceomarginata]
MRTSASILAIFVLPHICLAHWSPSKGAQINFYTDTQCTAYNGEVAAWWNQAPLVGVADPGADSPPGLLGETGYNFAIKAQPRRRVDYRSTSARVNLAALVEEINEVSGDIQKCNWNTAVIGSFKITLHDLFQAISNQTFIPRLAQRYNTEVNRIALRVAFNCIFGYPYLFDISISVL